MKNATRILTCVLAALTLSGCQGILHSFGLAGKKEYRAETSAQVFGKDELAQGRAALKAGYPAEAIKQFRLATLNEAAAPEAFNGLGIAYARLGRADLAERYFKAAVTLDSSNPKFAANLDHFYNSPLGNTARALAMREKEVQEALAAAELAAKVEGMLEPLTQPEQRGSVALQQPAAHLTRTSPAELRIATRAADPDRAGSDQLPSVAVRNPAAKAATPETESTAKRPTPAQISMLEGPRERRNYPIRITLTKPTSKGTSRPAPSTYPVRIALRPTE